MAKTDVLGQLTSSLAEVERDAIEAEIGEVEGRATKHVDVLDRRSEAIPREIAGLRKKLGAIPQEITDVRARCAERVRELKLTQAAVSIGFADDQRERLEALVALYGKDPLMGMVVYDCVIIPSDGKRSAVKGSREVVEGLVRDIITKYAEARGMDTAQCNAGDAAANSLRDEAGKLMKKLNGLGYSFSDPCEIPEGTERLSLQDFLLIYAKEFSLYSKTDG